MKFQSSINLINSVVSKLTFLIILLTCFAYEINAQSISGRTTVCVGNVDSYRFSGPPGSVVSSWLITGGTRTGSGSNISVTWTTATSNGQVRANWRYSDGEPGGAATLPVVVYAASGGVTAGTITPAQSSVCSGSSPGIIQNTQGATGSGLLTYYWFQKAASAAVFTQISGATSSTYPIGNLTESTSYYRRAVFQCTQVNSNVVDISVLPRAPVSITIQANKSSVCYLEGIAFSVSNKVNVGASPTYEWWLNGATRIYSTPNPYYTPPADQLIIDQWTYSASDIVTCKVYSSAGGCLLNYPATSNGISISINPGEIFNVNIDILPDKYPLNFCQDEISFRANPSHPASSYIWTMNGSSDILSTSQTYNPVYFQQGDYVSVTAFAASSACMNNTSASNSTQGVPITIFTDLSGVSITSQEVNSCQGNGTTQFTYTGTIPSAFNWNLLNAGTSTINQSGLVTWASNFSGTAAIEIRLVSCPSIFVTKTYVVNPQPPIPVTISQTNCNFDVIQIKPVPNLNTASFELYSTTDDLLATGTEFSIGRKLIPGTYTYKLGALSSSGCPSPGKSTITLTVTDNCDDKLNWIESTAFGPANQIVGQTKSYFDLAGNPLQSQSKNLSTGKIFTSGIVKDQYDRVVASSLAAPMANSSFRYDLLFMQDASGQEIADYNDLNSPQAFDNSTYGRAGWYYSSANTAEENVPLTNYPYSRTRYYEDGTGEVMISAAPGEDHKLGSQHEVLSGTFPVMNELDEYIQLRNSSVLPAQSSYTTLKQQGVQRIVRDENGKYTISISDKSGKTLMTARPGTWRTISNLITLKKNDPAFMDRLYFYQLTANPVTVTPTGGATYTVTDLLTNQPYSVPANGTNWAQGFYRIDITSTGNSLAVTYTNSYSDISYTYYDDAGRMVSSISPNGYQQLKVNNPAVPYSGIDKTTYTYNHRGWLMSMTEPDAGRTDYMYRSDGKIRFSQNALQRERGRFSYTHYDELDRPIQSGEYKGTTEVFGSAPLKGKLEYSTQSIWTGTDITDWTKTYYDIAEPGQPVSSLVQLYVRNSVSATENANIKTWYSYDEQGRVKWMLQKPTALLTRSFAVEYTYDFFGSVVTVVQKSFDGTAQKEIFYHHYEYDADRRLSKAFTSLDGTNKTQQAKYIYYLHGPLKRIELANNLQGIDFVYNIHGWLKSINHPLDSKDPGKDGLSGTHSNFKKDVFGLTLDYFSSEFTNLYQGADAGFDLHNIHGLPKVDETDKRLLTQVPYFKLTPAFREELVDQPLSYKQFSAENPEYKKLISRLNQQPVNLAATDEEHTEARESILQPPLSDDYLASITNAPVVKENEISAFLIPNYGVVWKDLVGVTVNGSTLTKTAASGWGNSGAASENVLPASTDGYVEFPVYAANQFMLGLSDVNTDAHYNTIDYAIYSAGTTAYIYQNGTNKLTFSVAVDDILRVERTSSTIYYKRNGTTVFTQTAALTGNLIIDSSITSTNTSISFVTSSFWIPSTPVPNPSYDIVWTDLVGVSVNGNTITKTAASGWGTGGAASVNALLSGVDGWVEYTLDVLNQRRTFGLSDINSNADYTSVDYGWYTNSNSVYVHLNGVNQVNVVAQVGDILRIERVGASIYFKRNGATVYTVVSGYTGAMIADASINETGVKISNAKASFWIPVSQGLIPDILEFAALKTLYDSLGGPAWTTKTNWPVAGSWPASATVAQMDTWYGIDILNGDISSIYFSTNNMVGKIPSKIGDLKGLRSLTVAGNVNIIGSLPASVGNLSLLTNLNLNSNKLTGSIPGTIGNLTQLTTLYLYSNSFSGAIPTTINQLTSLRDLRLATNQFTGLLPTMGSLVNLTYLDISNNTLLTDAAIPTWIGNLINLQSLYLYSAKRSGPIPNEMQNLINIRYLNLGTNQLTGSLPVWIGNLTNLINLYIYSTGLSGTINTDFSGLINLTQLILYSNQLSGPIPPSINKLAKLQVLQLQTNSFTGSIPYLGDLADITNLNLSSNPNLTPGPIPDWAGNLSKLTVLSFAGTKRTGTMPASLANLTNIDNLLLNDNQLTGTIPSYVGGFTKLKYFYVHNNLMSGELPSNWSGAVLLYYLSISGNKFTGAIPSSLLALPGLVYVYAHSNDFTSMPNFNTAVNKLNMYIRVDNNRLDFANLEPNFSGTNTHIFRYFVFTPQKNFTDVANISTPLNSQLEIPARTITALNTITWEKLVNATWTNVSATNQNASGTTYRINSADGTHAGSYRYKITSTKVTALTLYSDPIIVGITDVYNQQTTYTTGHALYNGNITTLAWRTDPAHSSGGSELKGMYLYKYDDKYQLKEAQFANPSFGALSSSYALDGNKFRENGLTYDPNGNLLTLKRYNEGQHKVHDFTYGYESLTNTNLIANADATSTSGYLSEAGSTITAEVSGGQTYVKATSTATVSTPGVKVAQINVVAGEQYTIKVQGYKTANGPASIRVAPNTGPLLVWQSPTAQLPQGAGGESWIKAEFTIPAGVTSVSISVLFSTSLAIGDAIYINRAELFKSQARSNRLASVTGYVNAYSYNAIGQMIGQDNVTGTDMYVNYDVTGKVTHVYSDAAKTILTTKYLYDDRGFRLAKETYNSTGVLQFTTWYIRDAGGNVMSIYNQNAGQPQITLTEVPVYGSGKLGLYRQKLDGGYEYIYELTDHLGNVRATLKEDEDVYLATMEDNGLADWTNPRVREMQYFKNLFETEKRDYRMNHTPVSTEVAVPERSSYLYWVDDGVAATKEDIVGPAIALKVDAGDTISLETWAKFERKVSYTRNATTAMMASLLGSAFVNASFGLETAALANQTFTNNLPVALAGTGSDPATRPFAYLNYIVFDESYVLKDAGAWRVPDNAGFDPGLELAVQPQQVAFSSPIRPQQKGYIYIWVSNESQATKVWFDDLKVTHRGKRVTQATDYYAYGSVLREQRTPEEPTYRYKYQGQYAEKDEETGWSHFELREYDPIVGRWSSKDPYAQFYSPYLGMGNNPVNAIDPDGGWSERGATWRRSLANFFGFEPGEIYESGGEYGFNITTPEGFAFMYGKIESETFGWNSPYVRYKTGDYVFMSFDLTVMAGGGVKETPIGWVMPMRGEDAFEVYSFHDAAVGTGLDVSGSFNAGKAWLLGPPNQVTIGNYEGNRHQIDGGYGIIGGGLTYAPPPVGANHFGVVAINGSLSLGAGYGLLTGNYNYGKTWIPNRNK